MGLADAVALWDHRQTLYLQVPSVGYPDLQVLLYFGTELLHQVEPMHNLQRLALVWRHFPGLGFDLEEGALLPLEDRELDLIVIRIGEGEQLLLLEGFVVFSGKEFYLCLGEDQSGLNNCPCNHHLEEVLPIDDVLQVLFELALL